MNEFVEIKSVAVKTFSNELTWLLDKIALIVMTDTPTREMSLGTFIGYALMEEDCLLYKAVGGFLSSVSVSTLSTNIIAEFTPETITAMRPNSKLKLTDGFNTYLGYADEERKKLNHQSITSDHLLLAALSKKGSKIKSFFDNIGLTYSILKNECEKVHNAPTVDDALAVKEEPTEAKKEKTDIAKTDPSYKEISKKKRMKSNVSFCRNLNNLAGMGRLTPIHGREKEIDQLRRVFLRRICKNAILVGPSGCGKSAIMDGIACMIDKKTGPLSLLNKTIFCLMPNVLFAGTSLRGMLEERLNKLFNELRAVDNGILFIDDFNDLSVGGNSDEYDIVSGMIGNMNIDSPTIVLASTPSGYNKLVKEYPELKRRFTKINIDPLTKEQCTETIKSLKKIDEDYHDVIIPDEIIPSLVNLSERFITETSLPASAVNVMDQACSIRHLAARENEKVKELDNNIKELRKAKEEAIINDDMDGAKEIDNKIDRLRVDLIGNLDGTLVTEEEKKVTIDDVYQAVSEISNVPISKVTTSERKNLANILNVLKEHVIGQDNALESIANAIKRNKLGLRRKNCPIYSAFFAGATGVGKTITAKTLAKEIFGDEKFLIKFDMSEYADKTSINKLIGAGAGYIGYENGGLLTEAVKTKKYAVVLFDEIEKADEQVYNILLQVLDEGVLTDNTGTKVDFRNTIIIFTSNVGAREANTNRSIGFVTDTNRKREEVIMKELKRVFPPEFINRLDDVVCFNTLTDDNLRQIIGLELRKMNDRIKENGYSVTWDNEVVEFILKETSDDRNYGARPIARTIEKLIENKIADIIIENDFESHNFVITIKEEQLEIIS